VTVRRGVKHRRSRSRETSASCAFRILPVVVVLFVAAIVLAATSSAHDARPSVTADVADVTSTPGFLVSGSSSPAPTATASVAASSPPTASPAPSAASRVAAASAKPSTAPSSTAKSSSSSATVGPLFPSGLGGGHSCTASVVSSPAGNTLVTAAHCLRGSGTGVVFAPGFVNGVAPYGTWVVTAVYAPAGWLEDQAPTADYAFLVVVPAATNVTQASVQSVVGGNVLATTPVQGTTVQVIGYPSDSSVARSCANAMTVEDGYPRFDCGGFVGGTSGGPWLAAGKVTGVIGGLNQGGCSADVSYSAPFTSGTLALFAQATSRAAPSTLPSPGGDGC